MACAKAMAKSGSEASSRQRIRWHRVRASDLNFLSKRAMTIPTPARLSLGMTDPWATAGGSMPMAKAFFQLKRAPKGAGEDGPVDFPDAGLAHEKFDSREKRPLGQLNLANVFQGDGNVAAGGALVVVRDGVVPPDALSIRNHPAGGFIQPAVGQDGTDPPQGGNGVDDA